MVGKVDYDETKLGYITARVAGDNGTARVSVQDEGPGIAREDQKRIFQKFVRGVPGGRDEVKGTGIGLAMVDAIARAHASIGS